MILTNLPKPLVITGDLNAQHHSWGSSHSNTYGSFVLDIVDRLNLCILNSGSATRRTQPHEGLSAPDLTLCSPTLASILSWYPLDSTYGSDHFPIIIVFPNRILKHKLVALPPPRLKYKLDDADWTLFKDKVEEKLSLLLYIQIVTPCVRIL